MGFRSLSAMLRKALDPFSPARPQDHTVPSSMLPTAEQYMDLNPHCWTQYVLPLLVTHWIPVAEMNEEKDWLHSPQFPQEFLRAPSIETRKLEGLPTELWPGILQEVPKPTLKALRSTSRKLSMVARDDLFRTITFAYRPSEILKLFYIAMRPWLACCVKHLHYDFSRSLPKSQYDEDNRMEDKVLSWCFSKLRNLRQLTGSFYNAVPSAVIFCTDWESRQKVFTQFIALSVQRKLTITSFSMTPRVQMYYDESFGLHARVGKDFHTTLRFFSNLTSVDLETSNHGFHSQPGDLASCGRRPWQIAVQKLLQAATGLRTLKFGYQLGNSNNQIRCVNKLMHVKIEDQFGRNHCWKRLESLHLISMVLYSVELVAFIQRHADTLKEIFLDDVTVLFNEDVYGIYTSGSWLDIIKCVASLPHLTRSYISKPKVVDWILNTSPPLTVDIIQKFILPGSWIYEYITDGYVYKYLPYPRAINLGQLAEFGRRHMYATISIESAARSQHRLENPDEYVYFGTVQSHKRQNLSFSTFHKLVDQDPNVETLRLSKKRPGSPFDDRDALKCIALAYSFLGCDAQHSAVADSVRNYYSIREQRLGEEEQLSDEQQLSGGKQLSRNEEQILNRDQQCISIEVENSKPVEEYNSMDENNSVNENSSMDDSPSVEDDSPEEDNSVDDDNSDLEDNYSVQSKIETEIYDMMEVKVEIENINSTERAATRSAPKEGCSKPTIKSNNGHSRHLRGRKDALRVSALQSISPSHPPCPQPCRMDDTAIHVTSPIFSRSRRTYLWLSNLLCDMALHPSKSTRADRDLAEEL